MLLSEPTGDLQAIVGGAVVYHQHLRSFAGIGLCEERWQERRKPARIVANGHDDTYCWR